MSHRFIGFAVALVLFVPGPARAQDVDLSSVLVRLIQNEVRLEGPSPGSAFSVARRALPAGRGTAARPYLFSQAIVSQLSSFPSAPPPEASASPSTLRSAPIRAARTSFGPSFAERAVTSAAGAGASERTTSRVVPARLKASVWKAATSGSTSHIAHGRPISFFEGDIVETARRWISQTGYLSLFANYGMTNRSDIGVAVPIVRSASMRQSTQGSCAGDVGHRPPREFTPSPEAARGNLQRLAVRRGVSGTSFCGASTISYTRRGRRPGCGGRRAHAERGRGQSPRHWHNTDESPSRRLGRPRTLLASFQHRLHGIGEVVQRSCSTSPTSSTTPRAPSYAVAKGDRSPVDLLGRQLGIPDASWNRPRRSPGGRKPAGRDIHLQ